MTWHCVYARPRCPSRVPMSACFAFVIAFRASTVFAVSGSLQAGGRVDIDARVQQMARKGFAGQVLVAHGDQILLDEAYGHADAAGTIPVTRATAYGVASLTKNFTAAAILALRDASRLRLSDDLGALFRDVPADKRSISVEQLLSHSSGLPQAYAADGETDRAAAVRKIFAQPLAFSPGSSFQYSDEGYVLLAAIIEEVSHQSYEHFFASKLFEPARMAHTFFWGSSDFFDPHRSAGMLRALDPALTRPQWGQRGSGGVMSTAADLHAWWQALQDGRVLRKDSARQLLTTQRVLKSGISVGFGWFASVTKRGTPSLWTRGNEDFGYNAILAVYPKEDYVFAVTSNVFDGAEPWSRVVTADLESLLMGDGQEKAVAR
jgi:CubicO group peptidase (beta-lactamase class C family)